MLCLPSQWSKNLVDYLPKMGDSPRHDLLMLLGLVIQRWHGRSRDEPPCFSPASRAVPGWWPPSARVYEAVASPAQGRGSCLPLPAALAGPACWSTAFGAPSPGFWGKTQAQVRLPRLALGAWCQPVLKQFGDSPRTEQVLSSTVRRREGS